MRKTLDNDDEVLTAAQEIGLGDLVWPVNNRRLSARPEVSANGRSLTPM